MDGQNDSIVLEEEIDPNYEPTEREVLEYATWLGMDLENEQDLFWIAREGLKAPLPESWKPCKTTDTEEIYYFNFASGQSTWDHPCDEFYRNLYEENKKKRTGGGGKKTQDTDERKKKEKEDVAELLGRGKSSIGGKKKKGALSRAEPLGPPTLNKAAPLEKKPLPGLSSKLGVLGAIGGGPTVSGLKSAASSLGRLRSEAKDADGSSRDDGSDSDDDAPPPINALSKPPLSGLLTKKPLLTSASASASLGRRDSRAEIDSVSADLEQKKQKLLDDHAHELQALETSHDQALEALRKKLAMERDAIEDDEATALKQRKRELGKKLHELESQFDKDESTVVRERKEQLKRMESDAESALAQRREDLDRELRSETERIERKHATKLRDLASEHKREQTALETKLATALGDKAHDVRAASELRGQVDALTADLAACEHELTTLRSERDAMLQRKQDAESKAACEIDALQRELVTLRAGSVSAAGEMDSRVDKLTRDVTTLESQLQSARNERDALVRSQTDSEAALESAKRVAETLQRELATLRASDGSAADETVNRIEQLTKELASVKGELESTRSERDALREAKSDADTTLEQAQRELNGLRTGDADESSDRAEQLAESVAALERELASARSESIAVLQSKSDAESKLQRSERELTSTKNELMRTKNELQQAHNEFDQAKNEFDRAQTELERHKNELKQAQNELNKYKNELERNTNELKQAKNEIHQAQNELDALRAGDVSATGEISAQVARLTQQVASLESELSVTKDALVQSKANAATKLDATEQEISALRASSANAANEMDSRVETLMKEMRALEDELKVTRDERNALLQTTSAGDAELESTKRELSALRAGDASATTELSSRIGQLTGELTALQQDLEAARDETQTLARAKTDAETKLEHAQHKVDALQRELETTQLDAAQKHAVVQQSLSAAQADAADVRNELSELQDQLLVLSKTNAQIKEQLLKESNEKRSLREQFDGQTDQMSRELSKTIEQLRQLVTKLEGDVETERSSREELQTACMQLRSDKQELELEKRKSESEFARLESEKRHLESEKTLLTRQLKELIEAQRQQEQSSALEGHAELTKQKWEIEQLQTTLKVVESDKTRLDERVRQLEAEIETLSASNHQLSEKARVGAYKAIELENKVRAAGMERDRTSEELQTAMTELVKWKDRAETKQKELNQTTLNLRSLEAEKQLLDEALAKAKTEKSDVAAQKAAIEKSARQLKEQVESQRQQEQSSALEGHAELTKQKWEIEQLQTTLKVVESDKTRLDERVRQLEAEIETLSASNHQLSEKARVGAYKAIELENKVRAAGMERDRTSEELQTAMTELVKWKDRAEAKQREVNQIAVSLRSVESERELAKEALANEKLAKDEVASHKAALEKTKKALEHELASLRFEHLSAETSQRSALGLEAQSVKLQLADVNRSELETHLADVASQLDVSTRRCAALEARCRDQAVDTESLHVEIASLRAATQRLHLSALETLPLMERLDYEHKKRVLQSDFQSQLRDFQEREDQALVRHKARLRAQCERQLDELMAELERKKRARLEHESALTLQMIDQVRQERDAKRSELRRQVRDELRDLERELTARKDHHLQTLSDAIRKEEDALAARARESRQALREEELVRMSVKSPVSGGAPDSAVGDQRLPLRDIANDDSGDDGVDNSDNVDDDDGRGYVVVDALSASSPQRRSGDNNDASGSRSRRRVPSVAWNAARSSQQRSRSRSQSRNRDRSAKEHRKWSKRLADEIELLAKTRTLVANQRRELKKQAEQLRRDKDDWRRDQHAAKRGTHSAILHEMRRMIEQNTSALNQSVRQLREREVWVRKREQSIAKMQRIVDKLRARARRNNNNNNNSGGGGGYLSDDDMDDDDDNGVRVLSDGECNQSELDSLLDTLEKLDDELVSEVGDLSDDLVAETSRGSRRPFAGASATNRYRGWEELSPDAEHVRSHWPLPFAGASEFVPASGAMWRLPAGAASFLPAHMYAPSRAMGSSGVDSFHSVFGAGDLYAPTAASSRLFGATSRPYPQRMASLAQPRRARSALRDHVPDRIDVFQRQISRWAKDRATVQHAATRHASWLANMRDELQQYGAKYQQDGEERREAEAAAITLLDDTADNNA